MRDAIVDWVDTLPLPTPLLVVLLAMIPIVELRGSIPVALALFEMGRFEAFAWSVIGNMAPVPIILWLLPPVMRWADDHWKWLHRVISRLHSYTERRHSARFDRLRDLALITFVAIPLPITGAWSGSLAAHVFEVPKKRAIPLIFVGVLIAGVIVTVFVESLGLALA